MWLKWPKLTFQRLNIHVWNVHMLMMSLYIHTPELDFKRCLNWRLDQEVKLTLWGVCRRSRGTTASVSPGPGCTACSGPRRNTLFRQRQDDLTEQVYLEVTHLFTTVSLWQPCWRHSCRDKHRHLNIVSQRKQAQNSCWVLRGLAAHVPVAAVISGKVFLQLALIHLRHKKKTPWNLCTSIQNQQKGNHSKGKWTSDFLSFKVPLQTKIKTDKISQLEHQMLELRVFRGADIYVWNI